MDSESETTSEMAPLLDDAEPLTQPNASPTKERCRFSPEILLIPVAFSSMLAMLITTTTYIDLLRQAVCRYWSMTYSDPATLPTSSPIALEFCDAPEVAKYFATVNAILGVVGNIISIAAFGILGRVLSHHRRKPVFLFVLAIGVVGSCLIPGSYYIPHVLAGWVFLMGLLFGALSSLLPFYYLLNVYIIDVCAPEDRTVALNKITGWGWLGTCISFLLGGYITTETGNPLIVFCMAAAIFAATFIYVVFVLPESFQEEKANGPSRTEPEPSSEEHPGTTLIACFFIVLEPLKVFLPTRNSDGTRNWRLTWCGVHTLLYMVGNAYASTAWLVFVTSKYNLSPADTGLFLTSTTVSGAISLTLIIPQIVRTLRPYYRRRTICLSSTEDINIGINQEPKLEVSDRLDVHLTFVSCVVMGVFYLSAATFTTNEALVLSGIGVGFASLHDPTTRSLVAGSVSPSKQGEALAAIEMVTNVGSVLSSTIMGSILSGTINTAPLLVFGVHLAIVLISSAPLFLIQDADRYREPLDD